MSIFRLCDSSLNCRTSQSRLEPRRAVRRHLRQGRGGFYSRFVVEVRLRVWQGDKEKCLTWIPTCPTWSPDCSFQTKYPLQYMDLCHRVSEDGCKDSASIALFARLGVIIPLGEHVTPPAEQRTEKHHLLYVGWMLVNNGHNVKRNELYHFFV